jgi:Domain of unknown function (DUF4432)
MAQDNSRNSLLTHIGRLSQVGGISPFVHAEGKAKGTSTLRVRTATGLEFWVVPDRGMDIYEASYKGQSLCWHSPTGVVHPSYYSNRGLEWLNSFFGGLLTTCGLSTAGAPSEDGGESLGLHGPISNTPAENMSWSEDWHGDDCVFAISGKVRETSVFGPNLLLERTISTSLRSSSLVINDSIESQGIKESPLMFLYHFNFGFPLLTERSQIHAPSEEVMPVDAVSAATLDQWSFFNAPVADQQERVYYHRMATDSQGRVTVVLVSDRTNPSFGVSLTYDAATLPRFAEWKMTGENHFVLGLEPANCATLGRAKERERGTLQTIAPGERREYRTELRILDGATQVADAIQTVSSIQLAR